MGGGKGLLIRCCHYNQWSININTRTEIVIHPNHLAWAFALALAFTLGEDFGLGFARGLAFATARSASCNASAQGTPDAQAWDAASNTMDCFARAMYLSAFFLSSGPLPTLAVLKLVHGDEHPQHYMNHNPTNMSRHVAECGDLATWKKIKRHQRQHKRVTVESPLPDSILD